MSKKVLLVIGVGAIIGLGLAASAHAISVVLTPADADFSGIDPHNPSPSDVATLFGFGGDLFDLYTAEVPPEPDPGDPVGPVVELGDFASSYSTSFVPETDPIMATITWDGGAFISASPVYLVVKGGKAVEPYWYAYDLSKADPNGSGTDPDHLPWDGKTTIELKDFWPERNAISHVNLVGPRVSVPEGGMTLGLIGLALLGLNRIRRKA